MRSRGLDTSPPGCLLDSLGELFGSRATLRSRGPVPQGKTATQTRPNLSETWLNLDPPVRFPGGFYRAAVRCPWAGILPLDEGGGSWNGRTTQGIFVYTRSFAVRKRIRRRAIMRRAWQAPNGGHGGQRSNFEGIRERAPGEASKDGILARSGSYGVLAKTS